MPTGLDHDNHRNLALVARRLDHIAGHLADANDIAGRAQRVAELDLLGMEPRLRELDSEAQTRRRAELCEELWPSM